MMHTELEALRDFLLENGVEGAYGLMVKRTGEGTLEVTHYIFPKFLPHVTNEMGAEEIGSHPAYSSLLQKAKDAGLEFDTADAHRNFTGLARRVQILPLMLTDAQLLQIKKVKGFEALLKLMEFLAGMENEGASPPT